MIVTLGMARTGWVLYGGSRLGRNRLRLGGVRCGLVWALARKGNDGNGSKWKLRGQRQCCSTQTLLSNIEWADIMEGKNDPDNKGRVQGQ